MKASCSKCPGGMITEDIGEVSETGCYCPAGLYEEANKECMACLNGMNCLGKGKDEQKSGYETSVMHA